MPRGMFVFIKFFTPHGRAALKKYFLINASLESQAVAACL